MGDAQSAPRDGKSEAAAEEQSAVEDGPSGDNTHGKLLKNNGQISESNGKPDGTIAEVNGHFEDQIAEEAIIVQEKDTSVTNSAHEEDENVQIVQKELIDDNEEGPIEIISMDAKQNDLNESFRKFFSNIGLKLTVKRGSADKAEDETEKEEVEKLEAVVETLSETKYEDVEQNTDLNVIQDNDSTTCPTLTDGTSEDSPETVEEKITETKEEEKSGNVEDREASVTVDDQDTNQNKDATSDESASKLEEEEFVSPIKKFFTTGIFSTLKKKKKEEEVVDKELVDMSKKAAEEQQDMVEACPSVEEEVKECKDVQAEVAPTVVSEEAVETRKSPSTDQDSEPEITSSQEKVQSSPLKRLFSGSSFKRRSKRQKGRRSSDSKLSDSGEHNENQIVASTETTEQQATVVVESPSPPPPATQQEEELSAWEAFKKLMTPKRSLKRASEETQVPVIVGEETKPNEGEQISDHSTEEGRKRKDSSHSWEAVLCGSGRRRSRKTSDSEDEQKHDGGEVESPNEAGDVATSTPKQAGSPSDSESSTWKSFKKLVTPKRKAKDDEESKDNAQSDSEATQEDSLFSIKKLLPGQKKRKPRDKPDQVSSDEAEKEVGSIEEDSETPDVVPLSEFDKSETEEIITQTDIESQASDSKLDEDESEQEHILEIPKTFVQEVQEHKVTPIIPALDRVQEELTEFSQHQQLSDIPEEGIITETIATSLTEEVVKDDTIAEDMVEITSEAITAQEPVDITMADETDELMLSAVSQLSESSKTSGNATPVPAEYDVKETEVLLKEVAETISTSTKADPIYSEEQALEERVVGSMSHHILERSAKEESSVLESHEQSDAVAIETGLHLDNLEDDDVELAATALSESLSEFKDAISTDYVSEVSKEEFESANIDIDEVHITKPERIIKEDSIDDSEYMVESISEVQESTEMALQDQDINQDEVSPLGSHEEEAEMARTNSNELLFEEKEEPIDNLEPEQLQIKEDEHLITSEVEIPQEEVESAVEKDTEEVIQESEALKASMVESTEVNQDHTAGETIVETLEGAAEVVTENILNEPALDEIQEATETSVKTEVAAENDFEIVNKQDLEDTQEPTPESNELPKDAVKETAVHEEECVTLSDVTVKDQTIADLATEQLEQERIDGNDEDKKEEHISEVIVEANKEAEAVSDSTIEPESKEQPEDAVQEVAVSKEEDATMVLLDKTSKEELVEQTELLEDTTKQELVQEPVSSTETQIKEQEDVVVDEPKQDGSSQLEEQPFQEAATEELDDDSIALQESTENQQKEIIPEDATDAQIEQAIISTVEECEGEVISQLDQALDINGDQTEVIPSEAQVEQVDHSSEVAEETDTLSAVHVSSVNEEPVTVQVLEDTVDLEKDPEISISSTEEPKHEVYIGKVEVNVEGQMEEEIPCTETVVAEVELAALTEESTATSQQVTSSMSDLIIQRTAEDCEKISEETSIPCLDNAEVIDEPKHEVHLSEVEQIDTLSAVHVSSVNEEPVTVQVLEDTVDLEKDPEISLASTEEPKHEVYIGKVEVNVEGQMEEEIPCTETVVAEVELAALTEESTATSHQVTSSMSDLIIQRTAEDCEKISEETSIPCLDNAEVIDEPKHEVHLSEVEQIGLHGEKEDEIEPPEPSNVEVQHAVTVQTTTCNFRDVASGIPDVFIETTTEMNEPMVGTVASGQEDTEAIETTTPLVVNNVKEIAQEGNTIMVMHVPSVQFQDRHRIQVQVVDVDIQSAETRLDTMLEVGEQEDKEVVDICNEMGEQVDHLSATLEIEQEIISEEDKVAIHEVVQHEKEIVPKSVDEPEDEEQPTDLAECKLSEDDQKTFELQEEVAVASSQDSVMTTKEQVFTKLDDESKEAQKQPCVQNQIATPSNSAVAIPQNTGIISSIGNVEAPSSLSLEFKLNIQFGQSKAPTLPSPPATIERAAPTSPPSAPPPQGPPVERNEPVKPTEMSEVGVQAVEEPTKQETNPQKSEIEASMAEAAVQATDPTVELQPLDTVVIKSEPVLMDVGIQSAEMEESIEEVKLTEITHNQSVLVDVGTQSAEIAEPVVEVKTTEMAMTQNQPVLMDVGIQSLQTVELVEDVRSTKVVTPSFQVVAIVQSVEELKNKEVILNKEVVLSQLVVPEVSEEQIKQTEDEDENQDVWMDAEEDIDVPQQTTMPLCEIEESFESQPDYFQETKAEFEESFEDIKKTALKCDIDSEGEDFAVALEDPQRVTAITTIEWD